MCFRQDLRAGIERGTFRKYSSHGIERIQSLPFPQQMDNVNDSTIEVTFHEVDVIALRGFIHWQLYAGTHGRAVKFLIASADDLERTRIG